MEKLIGTGRTGDIIHNSMEMAKSNDFKNVAKVWYNKTKSFEEGLASIREGYAQTEDILAVPSEMEPTILNKRLVFKYKDGRTFTPTEHAVKQIGSRLGIGTWLIESLQKPVVNQKGKILYERDEQDGNTLCTIINNAKRRLKSTKKYLWRTRQDGTLRAMLTDKYAIVNNEWLLEVWQRLIPGGRLSHWRGDSDTIYGNILIPDSIREEDDSDYGGLISGGNSEIGERRVSQFPSVFRAICCNGCIWDQKSGQKLDRVHRGKIDLISLEHKIRINLATQIPLITTMIDTLIATKSFAYDGDSMKPLFAQVAKDYKLGKPQTSGIYKGYMEEIADSPVSSRNLFGVINSITRAGQKFSNDTWHDFDILGGRLSRFTKENWDNLTSRASKLNVEQTEEMYALVS